ncbi:DoxX family protein [Ectobacillus panaciterrae]|uniref:DoxX family protein n=1 Tax=Ectobacillus panaciterrae TaxID=363872 RepID=UPI000429B358|nr:DoxX family protein [Ectobacillus panaciterrae]
MKKCIINTIIRIVFGAMFVAHGLAAFQMGLDNFSVFFHQHGLPSALAYVVSFFEVIGGVMLMAGWFTRTISTAFTFILAGAIQHVKLPMGLLGDGHTAGFELELAYQLIAVYLTVVEPKEIWGIDRFFKRSVSSREGRLKTSK